MKEEKDILFDTYIPKNLVIKNLCSGIVILYYWLVYGPVRHRILETPESTGNITESTSTLQILNSFYFTNLCNNFRDK